MAHPVTDPERRMDPPTPAPRPWPTRIFFGLLGAYLSLVASVALERCLRGAPVAPEIGSRAVDCGLLLATLLGGILIVATATIAGRLPGLARKTGIGGGALLVAQAVVTAGFVLAWDPASPSMAGMRAGELVGNGLWMAMGAAVLVLSARLRRPPRPGGRVEDPGPR